MKKFIFLAIVILGMASCSDTETIQFPNGVKSKAINSDEIHYNDGDTVCVKQLSEGFVAPWDIVTDGRLLDTTKFIKSINNSDKALFGPGFTVTYKIAVIRK